MSETSKLKQIPNNTINYIIFGKEKNIEKINVDGKNVQESVQNIPGIPMEISVDTHTCEIAADGTIIRKNKNGEKLPGKVTDKKVIEAVKQTKETER